MTNNNCNDQKDYEYFSHPVDQKKHLLLEHSIAVASKARKLLSLTKFTNSQLCFYSGLLHDIGKLNPYYQILFRIADASERQLKQKELSHKYEPSHSPFSAWIAEKLLDNEIGRAHV